jgi:membrane protease YdiL (CAAX protease family)
MSTVLSSVLLLLYLGVLWWFVRQDIADYAAFKILTETADRQRRYRAWILKSLVFLLGGSLIGLTILGRVGTLTAEPPEFAALSNAMHSAVPAQELPGSGFLVGFLGALLVGGVAGLLIAKRASAAGKRSLVGDISPLMPRNGPETIHTALLSVNAGISEELFFRLMLPLLLTTVFRNATYAFAAAAIIFGLVHFYEGWVGVLATTVLGVGLTVLYLWTRNLFVPMAVHACLDLIALVVRPTAARLFAADRDRISIARW